MQQKENGEILKPLMAAKKRIDKQKTELEKELKRLEAEQQSEQKDEQQNGEAFSLDAILNGTLTSEEASRKISSIKAALDLPYYADGEYRSLSIAYFTAVTAEAAADLEQNESEMEAAERAIAEAQDRLEQLRKRREDIRSAAADKIGNVGLPGVSHFIMDYSPEYTLEKYKKVCSKYN